MTTENIIGKESQVTLHYSIRLEDGSIADSSKQYDKPLTLCMGDGSLGETFENKLLGLKAKDKKRFFIKADEAFGLPNPNLVHTLARGSFQAVSPEPGLIVSFEQPDGKEINGVIKGIDTENNKVTVDFNHPLAGQDVIFELEVVGVADVAS
jgi:FKBP-type peptidyl-prolyl cis-trans isomerase SlpA